jgi:hypothetical protein
VDFLDLCENVNTVGTVLPLHAFEFFFCIGGPVNIRKGTQL